MSPVYTPGKLLLRKTWQPMDSDAAAYITAVEAADTAAGQSGGLEERTKIAIDNFVLGCKADGIWTAIKASCILAGARTLEGALVPLVGNAPTNPFVNPADESLGRLFVSGDYYRKTGLVGDGSTKYLDSNRAANADLQDNKHASLYFSAFADASLRYWMGTDDGTGATIMASNTPVFMGLSCGTQTTSLPKTTGFYGMSRNSSSFFSVRGGKVDQAISTASGANQSATIRVFSARTGSPTLNRIAFYTIGESLNLARLDSRVTDLINAFGAAIP